MHFCWDCFCVNSCELPTISVVSVFLSFFIYIMFWYIYMYVYRLLLTVSLELLCTQWHKQGISTVLYSKEKKQLRGGGVCMFSIALWCFDRIPSLNVLGIRGLLFLFLFLLSCCCKVSMWKETRNSHAWIKAKLNFVTFNCWLQTRFVQHFPCETQWPKRCGHEWHQYKCR